MKKTRTKKYSDEEYEDEEDDDEPLLDEVKMLLNFKMHFLLFINLFFLCSFIKFI